MSLLELKLKPRYKWFSNTAEDADDGWYGPCDTIEEAFISCRASSTSDVCYIGQGYHMTKKEQEEEGCEYSWQIDTRTLFKMELSNYPQEVRI